MCTFTNMTPDDLILRILIAGGGGGVYPVKAHGSVTAPMTWGSRYCASKDGQCVPNRQFVPGQLIYPIPWQPEGLRHGIVGPACP